MSLSSSLPSAPLATHRLDGIAADLEQELKSRLQRAESEIADARQLLEVAGLLADGEREAQIQAELSVLETHRQSLLHAAQILRARRRPPDAPATAPSTSAIPPRIEHGATNGSAPSSLHSRAQNGAAPRAATAPTDTRAGTPVTLNGPGPVEGSGAILEEGKPAATAPPRWTPRPLSVLELELETIESALAGLSGPDLKDLARFKAHASRFRGAYDERKRHPGSQAEWRAVEFALRDAQRAFWPDHYCIPLDLKTVLPPDRWQELALLYLDLAAAVEAVDWIETTLPAQSSHWVAREAAPLLECIGAATSLLHRWLRRHLTWARDDQQDGLFRRLRQLGEEHEQFIRSLQPEDLVPDHELESLARDLPNRLQALQALQARKAAQEGVLARLSALLHEEGFGGREGDDDRLCEAAAGCLEAKIPATDRGLRDLLLDHHWMLEGDERLTRLHQAVVEEIERRRRKAEEEEETHGGRADRLDDLTGELREQLATLLPRTRGKVGVMIGGTCRDDSRRAIEEALELSDLRWPDSDPSDPFDRSAREIARADIVFLTRFNRQRSKEAISLCRDQGKELIRLPGGYGLNQVIAQAYHQMFGRGGNGE